MAKAAARTVDVSNMYMFQLFKAYRNIGQALSSDFHEGDLKLSAAALMCNLQHIGILLQLGNYYLNLQAGETLMVCHKSKHKSKHVSIKSKSTQCTQIQNHLSCRLQLQDSMLSSCCPSFGSSFIRLCSVQYGFLHHTAHTGNVIQTMQRQLDDMSSVCCEINSKISGQDDMLHCLFSEPNTSTTNPQAKLRGCIASAQTPCHLCPWPKQQRCFTFSKISKLERMHACTHARTHTFHACECSIHKTVVCRDTCRDGTHVPKLPGLSLPQLAHRPVVHHTERLLGGAPGQVATQACRTVAGECSGVQRGDSPSPVQQQCLCDMHPQQQQFNLRVTNYSRKHCMTVANASSVHISDLMCTLHVNAEPVHGHTYCTYMQVQTQPAGNWTCRASMVSGLWPLHNSLHTLCTSSKS